MAGATASTALGDSAVGAIPAGWEVGPLGDLLVLSQYGLSIRGERTGAVPILRMNCQQDGRVVFRNLQFVDLEPRVLDGYRLHDGDLLFNRTNSYELVGRTALFEGEREAVFASYLVRLRVDCTRVHPAFLNLFLNLPPTQERLKGLATRGVSQSNISASKLKTLSVVLPPLDEQRRIAEVLGAVQLARVVENERVERLKALKAATMAKVFREGLKGGGTRDSEIGEIPTGWEIVRVADLGTLVTGTTPPTGEASYYGGEIPFIAPGDLGARRVVTVFQKTLSERGALVSRPLPAQSTMVVCIGATIGKVGMTGAPRSCTNQQINSIVPSDGMEPEFVHYLMEWSSPRLKPLSNPGPVPILSKSVFGQIEVAIPPDPDERREIGRVLGPIDAAAEASVAKLGALRECFDAILQSLMTGAIRVPEHVDA